MIRPLAFVLASIAVAGPAMAATPEQDVSAAEVAVNAAYANNDVARYFSYYSPHLFAFFPDGSFDYGRYKTYWTAFIKGGGRVEKLALSGMTIQVGPSGDAAVASYLVDIRVGGPGASPSDSGHFQETDTWFREQAGWKIVAVQYSHADK